LEVAAYSSATEDQANRIPLLWQERRSPDVLFAIFAEIPQMIVLNEPAEDLHFGTRGGTLTLRNPAALVQVNPPPAAGPEIALRFRDAASGVLDLTTPIDGKRWVDKVADLVRALPGAGLSFGSGDLAIQMVDPADKKAFKR
jgi:hypothetical protein